jgi:hypothetical protein
MLRPPLPARRDRDPVGAGSPTSMPPNQQPQKPAPPLILIPRDRAQSKPGFFPQPQHIVFPFQK